MGKVALPFDEGPSRFDLGPLDDGHGRNFPNHPIMQGNRDVPLTEYRNIVVIPLTVNQ